jgi:hypothetical protein
VTAMSPAFAGPHQKPARPLVWILFFLICFGLGYPTLNRYDPAQHLSDSAIYADMALHGPQSVASPFRFRILVPWLAREVSFLARGHTGSWDPLLFGFLIVNSMFVASTAYLTLLVGEAVLGSHSTALLGAAIYLLNFDVSNAHLAGLVDAGEAFFLMAVVACMFFGRWALLPLFGVLGTLTKESFVPFSIVMAVSWWWWAPAPRNRRVQTGVLVLGMIAAEGAATIVLQSILAGHAVWPWSFVVSMNSPTGYAANLAHSLVDRSSWYILIWLVPLGLVRIKNFPRDWVAATAVASLSALTLNAYHSTVAGGGGGIGRYIFNIAGPLLSLSVAACLAGGVAQASSAEAR